MRVDVMLSALLSLAASGDVDWDEAKAIAVELEASVPCVG